MHPHWGRGNEIKYCSYIFYFLKYPFTQKNVLISPLMPPEIQLLGSRGHLYNGKAS